MTIAELAKRHAELRRRQIELEGIDPSEHTPLAPAAPEVVARFEHERKIAFPPSYKELLAIHNGWLGFTESWSLAGVRRADTRAVDDAIDLLLDDMTGSLTTDEIGALPETENWDMSVIDPRKRAVLGVAGDGALLVTDTRNVGEGGEPEVVLTRLGYSVERRFPSFVAFFEEVTKQLEEECIRLEARGPRSRPAVASPPSSTSIPRPRPRPTTATAKKSGPKKSTSKKTAAKKPSKKPATKKPSKKPAAKKPKKKAPAKPKVAKKAKKPARKPGRTRAVSKSGRSR